MNKTQHVSGREVAILLTNKPVVIGLHDHYNTTDRTVYLSFQTWAGYTLTDICKAAHEAAHALQHARWPLLFKLFRLPLFKWLITLFLEWHASRYALRWIETNFNLTREDRTKARSVFTYSLRSYFKFSFA